MPESSGPTDTLIGPGSPHLVEFLGSPGAGKSTLAASILRTRARGGPRVVAPSQVLGRSRLRVPSRIDAMLRTGTGTLPARVQGVVRHLLWQAESSDPLAVLQDTHPAFLALIAHAPPPPDSDAAQVLHWRSWPGTTIATHVALRRASAPGRIVLVEEGLVQRANTVCAGAPSLAAEYFRTQPLPDALVVLRVAPSVAQQRLTSREKRPLLRHEGRTPSEVLQDLERTARLIDTAVEVLRGRGLVTVELDATEPTEVLRDRVMTALADLPDRRSPRDTPE